MPFPLRPRQQHNTSDPLYAPGAGPNGSNTPRIPRHLATLWVLTGTAFVLAYLPGSAGEIASWLRWLGLLAAVIASVPFLYRATREGMLWRLRNKLILTYLLIGLTPVVLFFTLVFLSAYVAAGQFAIHLAASHLQLQLDSMGTSDAGLAFALARRVEQGIDPATLMGPDGRPGRSPSPPAPRLGQARQLAIYEDTTLLALPGINGNDRTPLRLSDWVQKRQSGQMKVFAADGGVLYMAVVDHVAAGPGHRITVIGSIPVTPSMMDGVARGLGQVTMLPGMVLEESRKEPLSRSRLDRRRIVGGTPPVAVNLLDGEVGFRSTLQVIDWETGDVRLIPFTVTSRPSILFEQLFGTTGLTGGILDTVRLLFLLICLFFAVLEIFAFYLAVKLTRSMTGSVEDLYAATLSIDSGNLQHRIQVQHDDQLGDLGRSFNRMSWSLGRLIDEQKEKERMQSELNIAQEVQENLFPRAHIRVPSLDLHGICRPARSVSGDYYDFLVFHDDQEHRRDVTGVGLALGDISGKGISAALLMATLHSAVRAYRFASEEVFTGSARSANAQSLESGEMFESPSRILALLNRHLYRSTQPEKYATLFLAHYDEQSHRLTYSNAGQLPPFLLHKDGSARQLTCGGTVVGLLDGMRYDQETVPLEVGDLLIAYSDGVTEPENDFGDFGEDRLLEVVRRFRDEPLQVISAEVMRALDAWIGGGEQPDDITLVLARRV